MTSSFELRDQDIVDLLEALHNAEQVNYPPELLTARKTVFLANASPQAVSTAKPPPLSASPADHLEEDAPVSKPARRNIFFWLAVAAGILVGSALLYSVLDYLLGQKPDLSTPTASSTAPGIEMPSPLPTFAFFATSEKASPLRLTQTKTPISSPFLPSGTYQVSTIQIATNQNSILPTAPGATSTPAPPGVPIKSPTPLISLPTTVPATATAAAPGNPKTPKPTTPSQPTSTKKSPPGKQP